MGISGLRSLHCSIWDNSSPVLKEQKMSVLCLLNTISRWADIHHRSQPARTTSFTSALLISPLCFSPSVQVAGHSSESFTSSSLKVPSGRWDAQLRVPCIKWPWSSDLPSLKINWFRCWTQSSKIWLMWGLERSQISPNFSLLCGLKNETSSSIWSRNYKMSLKIGECGLYLLARSRNTRNYSRLRKYLPYWLQSC